MFKQLKCNRHRKPSTFRTMGFIRPARAYSSARNSNLTQPFLPYSHQTYRKRHHFWKFWNVDFGNSFCGFKNRHIFFFFSRLYWRTDQNEKHKKQMPERTNDRMPLTLRILLRRGPFGSQEHTLAPAIQISRDFWKSFYWSLDIRISTECR